jgi:MOSC domain-containing protein YiiM
MGAATSPVTKKGHRLPVLVSVNVGLPKNVSWQGRTVYTGVWKRPVDGPAMVRRLNIDGDGQGDLGGHGGEQRAVLVYQIESYRYWQEYFGRDDFGYGQFGENLTVDGLADDEVCIGDRYRIGQAEFEVTQPRVTCYRVGLRLGEPELPALLVGHHRPGFYMRVITEGHIQAGDPIVKTRIGPHALSVADTDALLYLPGRDRARLRVAVQIPALSPGWQGSFRDLLAAAGGDRTAGPHPRPPGRPGLLSGGCVWPTSCGKARRCPRSTWPRPMARRSRPRGRAST